MLAWVSSSRGIRPSTRPGAIQNHLSARRVDAAASPLDDPLDTPAAQAMRRAPASRTVGVGWL
ncbi:MAG: hypothetical protein CMH82_01420 [Nocardioides sp.]|nr:hypothetical protein [Nocardioides sp.]